MLNDLYQSNREWGRGKGCCFYNTHHRIWFEVLCFMFYVLFFRIELDYIWERERENRRQVTKKNRHHHQQQQHPRASVQFGEKQYALDLIVVHQKYTSRHRTKPSNNIFKKIFTLSSIWLTSIRDEIDRTSIPYVWIEIAHRMPAN